MWILIGVQETKLGDLHPEQLQRAQNVIGAAARVISPGLWGEEESGKDLTASSEISLARYLSHGVPKRTLAVIVPTRQEDEDRVSLRERIEE